MLNPLYLQVHLDWKLKDCDDVTESCPVLDPRSQGLIQEKNLISEKRKVPTIFFQTGNQKIDQFMECLCGRKLSYLSLLNID